MGIQIDMLVQLKRKRKSTRKDLKKLAKLMEYYLMPSKNLATMLVKIWIVQLPVHHIHLEVSVNPWMQHKCSKPFSETEMEELECITLFIITLALEVIMATCQELSSNLHRNCIHTYC